MALDSVQASRVMACALLCGAPALADAEAVELKFDWGPELKAVVENTLQPRQGATPPPSTQAQASSGTVTRAEPMGTRYRIAATRQADGSYVVKIVDYVVRLAFGDVLLSADPRSRQSLTMMAPDVKFDAAGRFAGLQDPDGVDATLRQIPRPSIEQRTDIPPEAREQARAQLQRMLQLRSVEARAAQPWYEAVAHWAGRRLELGETYRATETVDAVAQGPGPGPYEIERSWTALGRERCPKDASDGANSGSGRDCVRLRLVSRYSVSTPTIVMPGSTSTINKVTFESEVTLLTEPATLRPHEVVTIRRSIGEGRPGPPREFEHTRTTWTYGAKADVPLQASFDPSRMPLPTLAAGSTAPPPPPPARIWPTGTPERMVAEYFELVRARDIAGWVKLLHPDLIARAAKRMRGPDGVRASDETRKALLGDESTLDQVDAMTDAVLFERVMSRAVTDGSVALVNMPMGGAVDVIGHALDAAGHAHVVVHSRMRGLPVAIAYDSFTVVADRLPAKPREAMQSGEPALPACDPKTDMAGCWRIWLYNRIEFAPLLRRRFSMEPGVVPGGAILAPPPPSPSQGPPAVIVAPANAVADPRP